MNKNLTGLVAALIVWLPLHAQKVYEIDVPSQPKVVKEGHLRLGGKSPDGGSIDFTSFYMRENGLPTIPVMGEMHYSRYPREQWEEEILKIKAGGVTVIPTYVFWCLHEPYEGEFHWEKNLDLRHFVELCGRHGMKVIVRIGPFCHGEIRNGGLPDWLLSKPLDIRSNDSEYLSYVRRLYQQTADQLKGLYYQDGGPIIGCQIENEHQHSAGYMAITYPEEKKDMTSASYDKDITKIGVSVQDRRIENRRLGDEHMMTLKRMAEEAGIITPFYTATGWGMGAVLGNEGIPVTAAYTYPFWEKPRMSQFCMFKDLQKNPDYGNVRYNLDDFPSFCAEMGVGIQMIYPSRPIVTAQAAQALMVRTLGSGSNGIGYYMYHGGSTPKRTDGIGYYSEEPMGCPKISYDFQAPLGEFGLEHGSYRYLRLIHHFVNDFGDLLAPMEVLLPASAAAMTPSNCDTLRYSAREKDGSGFVFMINFQDHDLMRHDMDGLQLRLNLRGETLTIPAEGGFSLPKDESMILPFNLRMGGSLLKYSTAQLLLKIDDAGTEHYFFFAPDGVQPEYCFDMQTVQRLSISGGKRKGSIVRVQAGLGSTFEVLSSTGNRLKITTLTMEQALNTTKIGNRLVITPATVVEDGADGFRLLSLGSPSFDYVLYPSAQGMKVRHAEVAPVEASAETRRVGTRWMGMRMNLPESAQVAEYFLQIDYTADVVHCFLNNELIHDEFYHGAPWRIGLKRYADQLRTSEMSFYFRPLRKDAPFLEYYPSAETLDFSHGSILDINTVTILPLYQLQCRF